MIVVDLRDEKFRRDVARLHGLGPRATFELLVELGRRRLLRTDIEALVSRYARLDPAKLAITRGAQIPPSAAVAVADYLDRAIAYAKTAEAATEDEEVRTWLNEIVVEIEDAEGALAGAP
jgi:hypothetical protein